jgi:hypothetical protein
LFRALHRLTLRQRVAQRAIDYIFFRKETITMAIATSAQALASEQEWVRPELEDLALSASILWKRIGKNTQVKPVSDRPSRIPTMPSRGGKPRLGSMNGADMGIGSGPTQVPGQLTTVCYIHAFSYTAQAEYATDSDEKAIENFATLTRSIAPKQMADFMDILCQGNGSNELDTVVGLVASGGNTVGIVVNNANFFLDDQDIDVWTAVGGTYVATVTVESSDIIANTIWLATGVPTGTITVGQGLFVSGAPATANTGLAGLRAYQIATNTGNWMGVNRADWPGKYITPTVAANGALTPQMVRTVEAQIQLSKGEDAAEELVAHSTPAENLAWEQNALLVQHIDMAMLKGDSSVDMLQRKAPTTMGGHENLINPRALPGFIDFLKLKNIFRIETKPVDFYDVGGQTLFPIYGNSGGLVSAMVFYMVVETQIGIVQTRENAFISGITIPSGLFGAA